MKRKTKCRNTKLPHRISVKTEQKRKIQLNKQKIILFWETRHKTGIKGATPEDLKRTITTYLEKTKNQPTRLKNVFASIREKAVAKKCLAMEGLLAEATALLQILINVQKFRRSNYFCSTKGQALRDRILWDPSHFSRHIGIQRSQKFI